jgi:hypothetical protein
MKDTFLLFAGLVVISFVILFPIYMSLDPQPYPNDRQRILHKINELEHRILRIEDAQRNQSMDAHLPAQLERNTSGLAVVAGWLPLCDAY